MDTKQIWENVGKTKSTGFLSGGGRMAEAILAFDWSKTSIGPIQEWPVSLRSVVQMAVLSRQAICLFWGKDLNLIYNDDYAPILGKKEKGALGTPFQAIWSDVWLDIAPIVQKALSGQGTWEKDFPLVMTRNGYEETTYWSFSYSPLYDDDGNVAGLINITTDATSAVTNEDRLNKSVDEAREKIRLQNKLDAQQRVIQREMSHRIKNILSMTMAVVSQTLRHSDNLENAAEVISKRISALSNAQDLITGAGEDDADVGTLAMQVLQPHITAENRITFGGPNIAIPGPAALGMALALHELATNAVKYGALANDEGIVSLHWTMATDGAFRMEWQETGGPVVATPTRTGFGSRLMKRIVPGYFAGTGESFYDPSGFRYVLSGIIETPIDDGDATIPHRFS